MRREVPRRRILARSTPGGRSRPDSRRSATSARATPRRRPAELDLQGGRPGPGMLVCFHSLGATGAMPIETGSATTLGRRPTRLTASQCPDRLRAAVRYQVKYGGRCHQVLPPRAVCSAGPTKLTRPTHTRRDDALVDEAHRSARRSPATATVTRPPAKPSSPDRRDRARVVF